MFLFYTFYNILSSVTVRKTGVKTVHISIKVKCRLYSDDLDLTTRQCNLKMDMGQILYMKNMFENPHALSQFNRSLTILSYQGFSMMEVAIDAGLAISLFK